MPTYIGENKIVDRYLGDRFLKAAYIGDKKVYDPYAEITGNMPIVFKSRAAVALKNYRIYGTAEGAGVETENLVTEIIQNASINSAGKLVSSSVYNASIAPITDGTTYTILRDYTTSSLYYAFFTDLPVIDSATYDRKRYEIKQLSVTFTAPITGYVALLNKEGKSTVAEGNTAIPYGYKLPMTVESGETENLFDGTFYQGSITKPKTMVRISSQNIPIEAGTTYSLKLYGELLSICDFALVVRKGESVIYDSGWKDAETIVYTVPQNTGVYYAEIIIKRKIEAHITPSDAKILGNVTLTKGSTPPDHYIPHRYKSGIPIYIGDGMLSEEEYVDYGEQKVYKYAEPPKIYGWHVDPSISDPANAITYLGDAVGKTPAAMETETFSYGDWYDAFFMPRPCMVKYDGTVDYYLDPNDYSKKADGTTSDIADPNYDGNAMMEWPLLWWKYEIGETEEEGYFYVANRKPDDTYHCWCNYDADDNITEHFYTAIYNGTGTDKMRSISGVALTNANGNGLTTGTQEITRATANNTTDKTEWYIDVWSDRMLINGLLILMGKSLNSQAVFGRGLDSGSQSAKEAYITGALNDKGLFWGVTSAGTSGVKVFGMENWWGCAWRRTAGLIGLPNGNTAYKMTYGTADGSTANGYNTTGDGYLVDTVAKPADGYFKNAKFGKFGYLPLMTGGSAATYYSDYWHTNNEALTFVLVGGATNVGLHDGCSCFHLKLAAGDAGWNISSSLSCKPLAKTAPEPDLIPTDPPVPLPPIPTYKGENTLDTEAAPNVFDYSSLVMGSINVPGGEEVTSNTHKRTPYIEVDAGSVYILQNILSGGAVRIHQYTSNSSAGWTRSDLFNEGNTISLDATTKYVRMVATIDTYQSDTYFGLGKYSVGTVVIKGRINEMV